MQYRKLDFPKWCHPWWSLSLTTGGCYGIRVEVFHAYRGWITLVQWGESAQYYSRWLNPEE